MKNLLLVFLALVIVSVASLNLSPKAGAWAYAAGADLESRLYGLEKRTQALGDLTMTYWRGGAPEKPAIVMVHGYTADKTVWMRFAHHFTDDYDIIIPDLAGHGETPFDPAWDYSQQAQAERIAALLDELGITRVHIIGNSMGGYISAYFALAFPQRTLSATMVDPAGVISPIPSEMDRMVADGRNPFEVHDLDEFAQFYPMTMARPPYLPNFVLDVIGRSYIERRKEYQQIFSDIATEPRLTERLHQIVAPALLIWGDQDRLIDVSASQVWAEAIPGLSVKIMPGYGHMPMVEAPADTASLYRQFLQGSNT